LPSSRPDFLEGLRKKSFGVTFTNFREKSREGEKGDDITRFDGTSIEAGGGGAKREGGKEWEEGKGE
jgi:hypothetical protein